MNLEFWLPNNISSQAFLLAQHKTGDPSVDKALNDTDKLINDINSQIDANQQSSELTPGNSVGGIAILDIIGAVVFFLGKKFTEGAADRAGQDAYDHITGRKEK